MRTRVAIFTILGAGMFAACRSEPIPDPIPAEVLGEYTYFATGSWAGKVLWAAKATLELSPDGTFDLSLDKKTTNGKDSTDRTHGTYKVVGDRILITESRAGGGIRAGESHSLGIRPDSLVGQIIWKDHHELEGTGYAAPVFVKRQI